MKIIRISFIPLMFLLSSCFGGGAEIPQDNFYRLADISQNIKQESKPGYNVVAVAMLKSDALHRERAILYSNIDQPLHLRRYHYHHWNQVPNQLIQEHLISYLRHAGFAKRVVRYGEETKTNANITGHIKKFERVLDGGQVVVKAELELHLETMKSPRSYFQSSYAVEIETKGDAMHDTVQAFSQALELIYYRFVADFSKQDFS